MGLISFVRIKYAINTMENLLYPIALTLVPGVGPITARNLISYCGGAAAVFESSRKALRKIPGIGEHVVSAILETDVLPAAEREIEFLEKRGIQAFTYLDKNYPARLKHYPDSPLVLFYNGTADLNAERIVGIVGTRQPTPTGITLCEEVVEALAPYKVLVASGLAYGIDATAHRKSVDCGLDTVAVVGHGLQMVYPAAHRSLAKRICEQGGMLSEYTHTTMPDREHFPMRNRIIAAMCDALIVVETATQGGSIITAHLANQYNKDVFAIPGRPKDKYSQGCNQLIKNNQAVLAESAEDVVKIMGWELDKPQIPVQAQMFQELNPAEQKVVDILQQIEEVSIDRLTYEAQLTPGQMAGLLLGLEFKGVVRPLPGKRYMLA